jgi:hypothetical protein
MRGRETNVRFGNHSCVVKKEGKREGPFVRSSFRFAGVDLAAGGQASQGANRQDILENFTMVYRVPQQLRSVTA